MKKLLLALALFLSSAPAWGQCNGIFQANTLCGRQAGSGPPGPVSTSVLTGVPGGTSGQIQYNNAGSFGGFTPGGDLTFSNPNFTIANNAVTSAKIAPGAANTMKGSLNGSTTSDIAITACTLVYQFTQWVAGTGWQCGINPVLPSRAIAATLNLSAFSTITTQGYANPGDGGGAAFVKLAAGTALTDSYVLTGTIAGGSGYTNGTYKGVFMQGGSGTPGSCLAVVTISGGVMTAVNISGTYCPGYKVGDVLIPLNAQVGGTGSGATFTIATIQAAQGSFTDTASNPFQITPDQAARPNVLQYGCKLNWNGNGGGDATATNDILCFRSAVAQASVTTVPTSPTLQGNTINIPKGVSFICDGTSAFATLQVPFGVTLHGASRYAGSTLKQCTAEGTSTHVIALCNPNAASGEFGCALEDLGIFADGTSAASTVAVYSNSGQQFPMLTNVYIQPNNRGCIKYETGIGGAANAIFEHIDCEQNSAAVNVGASINSSNTQVVFRDSVWGCAPSTCAAGIYAISNGTGASGSMIVENFHIEGHTNAMNIAGSDLVSIRNGTITSQCTNGIVLQSTNANNTTLIENIQSSCSVSTIQNGHSGGVNFTGSVVKQVTCGGAACS